MLKVIICSVCKCWVKDPPAEPSVLMSLTCLGKGTCACFCTMVEPLLCVCVDL